MSKERKSSVKKTKEQKKKKGLNDSSIGVFLRKLLVAFKR